MTHENETAELLSMVETSVTQFLETARARPQAGAGDAEVWREVVEMGLPLVALPEAMGGSGLGAAGFACVARQFGKAGVAQPYVACGVAPVAAIGALGTSGAAGEFAMATLALVSDGANRVGFAAHAEGAPAVLNGGKLTGQWRLVAHPASHLLVTVGDALALVALNAPGAGITAHKALDGGEVATVALAGAAVLHSISGPEALRAGEAALAAARLAHASVLDGLAASAFGQTQDYIKTRAQFNQTIASFQAIQHRSVDQFMAVSLTDASIDAASTAFDADPTAPQTRALIAAALARASTSAALVARESVQMHGGIGFTAELDVGRYVRALTGAANLYGTARENRRIFAGLESTLEITGA